MAGPRAQFRPRQQEVEVAGVTSAGDSAEQRGLSSLSFPSGVESHAPMVDSQDGGASVKSGPRVTVELSPPTSQGGCAV